MCAACGVSHDELKRDETRWISLSYVGRQHVEADEFGPAETLELRNAACGSTLAKLVEVTS